MKITAVLIFLVFSAGAKAQDKRCEPNGNILTCRCASNEDIDVFYDTNNTITSLEVSSCASATLSSFMGPDFQNTITSIKVENITDMLNFCPILYTISLKRIEFVNVRNLKEFKTECNFISFTKLEYFHIENTTIGTFDQTFDDARVVKFILKNVTILNLQGLEFSSTSNGSVLEIIDSYINVTANTSLFSQAFHDIKIANTTFNFPHGGNILISGTHIHLRNNTFLNVSVDVMGKHKIHLIDTCAEGHGSAMRLHVTDPDHNHQSIVSHGNRVPSQIIYIPKITDTDYKCPGARCDCLHIRPPIMRKVPGNYGQTIHQKTRNGFYLWFIIVAARIVAKI